MPGILFCPLRHLCCWRAISLVVKHRLFFPLAALLLAVTVVFGLPDFHITFAAVLPLWLNRVLTVFLWLAAAFSLRLFNANDGLVAIETLGISFGIFILSLIGALPFLVGCFSLDAAAVSFALLLYGAYPAQISSTAEAATFSVCCSAG